MAAGIRIPITMDISDIPKSTQAAIKKIKTLERQFGKLDLRVDDKHIKNIAHATDAATKNFKSMAGAIRNATSRAQTLQKAIAKIKAGGNVGVGMREQIGTIPKVSQKLTTRLSDLEGARASIQGAKNQEDLNRRQKEYNELKKKVLRQLDYELGKQQKLIASKQKQIQIEVKASVSAKATLNRVAEKEQEILISLQKQNIIRKAGKQIGRDRLRQLALVEEALERQIGDTRQLVKLRKQLRKETKKERGAGLMGGFSLKGRVGWFAVLRIFWEIYRIVGKVAEAFIELDEATARAMRTMRSETGKSYKQLEVEVEQRIRNIGKATGAAYRDIGEALYQLSSAGLSAEKALAGVNTVVSFATITETSMTDAAKLVAGAMNNFGDSMADASSETEKMAGIAGSLIYVWERNQIDMNEMVQGLNQSVNTAQLAGLRFEELAVIIGNLGTMMIRSGRGGRSFRTAIVQIAAKGQELSDTFNFTWDPTQPLSFLDIMDNVHKEFKDMNKTALVTEKIFSIFGKRGAPAVLAMLKKWEKIREEISGIGSAMELAVNQQVKLIRLQERYKGVSKVTWNILIDAAAEYLNFMKLIGGMMNEFIKTSRRLRAANLADMGAQGLIDSGMIKSAGEAFEELANANAMYMTEVEAIREKMRKEERSKMDEDEAARTANWVRLILVLKEVQRHFEELASAEKEEKKAAKAAITPEQRARAYEDLRDKLKELGHIQYENSTELRERLREERAELERIRKKWIDVALSSDSNKEIMEKVNQELEKQVKVVKEATDALNEYIEANKIAKQEQFLLQSGLANKLGAETDEKAAATASGSAGLAQYRRRKAGVVTEDVGGQSAYAMLINAREQQRLLTDEQKQFNAEWEIEASRRNVTYQEQLRYDEYKLELQRMILEQKLLELMAEEKMAQMELDKAEALPDDDEGKVDAITSAEDKLSAVQLEQDGIRNEIQLTSTTEDEVHNKRMYQHQRFLEAMRDMSGQWTLMGAITKAYGEDAANALSQAYEDATMVLAEWGKESKGAWDAYKALAISKAIISTFEGAQYAYTSLAPIPVVGPFLGVAAAAAAVTAGIMRVNQIRSQKPEGKAKGGVFDGPFEESYSRGGVTAGVTRGIIGDNPSGKELVVPSENIKKDWASGYVRESDEGGGGGAPTIVNVLTEQDIAGAMATETGGNVIVNRVVQNSEERKEVFRTTREVSQGKTPGQS